VLGYIFNNKKLTELSVTISDVQLVVNIQHDLCSPSIVSGSLHPPHLCPGSVELQDFSTDTAATNATYNREH
jgi:hypothetical protein